MLKTSVVKKNNMKSNSPFKQDKCAAAWEKKKASYMSRKSKTSMRRVDGKMEKYENNLIPLTLNYSEIKALSTESREKLRQYKPRSIGQASRIAGVTPSDISVLLVYLKR